MKKNILVLLFVCMPFTTSSLADWRCDCSIKQGACTAKIKKTEKQILISSSVPQCSQVIWYADGQPHSTTVLDGISAEEWLGPSTSPKLAIDSCTVCKDKKLGDAAASGSSGKEYADIRGNWSFRFSLPDCTTCTSNGNASLNVEGKSITGEMNIRSLFFGSTDSVEGEFLSERTLELTQVRNGKRLSRHSCEVNSAVSQIVCNYTEITGQAGVLVFER